MKKFKILFYSILISSTFLITSCTDDNFDTQDSTKVPLCAEDHNIDTRQERITTVPLFDPCDAANLFVLVDLSQCIGNDWDCAVPAAIAAYNALPENIGIGMTLITNVNQLPSGEAVNITIDCGAINAIGAASPRATAQDICTITLNDDVVNNYPCGAPNCCQLQKTVMHELGHALSLGHTQGGIPNSAWIPGTPMGEANSIFNSTVVDGCNGGCVFTNGDLAALEILYDACDCPGAVDVCLCDPDSQLNQVELFPHEYCNGDSFTWCPGDYSISNINPPYSWNWVTCNPSDAAPDGNGCIDFVVCADDDEAESLSMVITHQTKCDGIVTETRWFEFGGEDCPDGEYCDPTQCN